MWEYFVESISAFQWDDVRSRLNFMGRQGWELVTINHVEHLGLWMITFKRPLSVS